MPIITRQQRRQLARDNAKYPAYLVPVPEHTWPDTSFMTSRPARVMRSRYFSVLVFHEHDRAGNVVYRLSVNRTELGDDGRWKADISWEELQQIKRECGFGHCYAIEVFPDDCDIVNVANMRHLWVPEQALDIGCFK